MTTEASELSRAWDCRLHGPYEGVGRALFDRIFPPGCPRCQEAKEQAAAQEAALRLRQRIARSCVPQRFQSASFDDYICTTAPQRAVREVCQRYAQGVVDGREQNLLLLGGLGTGKTMLASVIGGVVMRAGAEVRYATVRDLLREIRATWSKASLESEDEAIERFAAPSLLILDEVGVQAGGDNEKHLLFDVLDRRYRNQRPSIVISNENTPGVTHALGDRVIDRLAQDGRVVTFNWASERRKKGLRAPTAQGDDGESELAAPRRAMGNPLPRSAAL